MWVLHFVGRETPLPDHTIKNYMYQLCKSLKHMHRYLWMHFISHKMIILKMNYTTLYFIFLQLWDLSQRCKARKHPHQSEIITLSFHGAHLLFGHIYVFDISYYLQQNGLKLGDFGSCQSVFSKPPHTEYISTRWYRAPECLLTDGYYSLKMDMWSAGCVFFEIMRYPFPLWYLAFPSLRWDSCFCATPHRCQTNHK